jgi:hypothetical protein
LISRNSEFHLTRTLLKKSSHFDEPSHSISLKHWENCWNKLDQIDWGILNQWRNHLIDHTSIHVASAKLGASRSRDKRDGSKYYALSQFISTWHIIFINFKIRQSLIALNPRPGIPSRNSWHNFTSFT